MLGLDHTLVHLMLGDHLDSRGMCVQSNVPMATANPEIASKFALNPPHASWTSMYCWHKATMAHSVHEEHELTKCREASRQSPIVCCRSPVAIHLKVMSWEWGAADILWKERKLSGITKNRWCILYSITIYHLHVRQQLPMILITVLMMCGYGIY